MSIDDVPPHFYIVKPASAAVFSTVNGTKPKRELVEPFPMPVIRSDMESDVDARANQLIKEFPATPLSIMDVSTWWDLHKYFDSHDLWVDGARFCYYVLLAIARKFSSDRQATLLVLTIPPLNSRTYTYVIQASI